MKIENISLKIIGVGFVALVSLIATFMVQEQISERENRYLEVHEDIASSWGRSQTILGPVLVFDLPTKEETSQPQKKYVLPKHLNIETTLEPETRSRGIFNTTVYTEKIVISGSFESDDFVKTHLSSNPIFTVSLSDTRSVEKQINLMWNSTEIQFQPGTNVSFLGESGIHAFVPLRSGGVNFAFEISLKGSKRAMFIPLGLETTVTVASLWNSPQFVGSYLPSSRTISEEGFSGTWNISSFGRNYPQVWVTGDPVSLNTLYESSFGVELYEGVDLYTQIYRSVKYAVLFILITFTAFFLFDILKNIRIHPIQYLLLGSALALFYLLLLSLTEHIGFFKAYVIATFMISALITAYSISVLKETLRAGFICIQLLALYGYMYFVLKLEDYALLFGSLLIFVLLSSVMYLTRNLDWFTSTNKN